MGAIYKREMLAYFTCPTGYVFAAIFFAISGAVFSITTFGVQFPFMAASDPAWRIVAGSVLRFLSYHSISGGTAAFSISVYSTPAPPSFFPFIYFTTPPSGGQREDAACVDTSLPRVI